VSLIVIAVAVAIVLACNWPYTQPAVTKALQDRFARTVQIRSFRKTFFPPDAWLKGSVSAPETQGPARVDHSPDADHSRKLQRPFPDSQAHRANLFILEFLMRKCMDRTFYIWTRDLHSYIGLALSPLVRLFAISVILLDHPSIP